MKVPLRIYYDKKNGQPIQQTGNFEDKWLLQYETVEEQIPKYKALSERNRDTFDVIELPYGAYAQDFATCTGYRVNPETKELEFSYPDPNVPEEPQPFQKPLSVEVEELKQENLLLKAKNQALTETTDFHEELIVELAMVVYK